MGKLSSILNIDENEQLRRKWDDTEAAEEFAPLPSGEYVALIIAGELFNSRTKGTPGFKLTFKVLEGVHAGRQFWHDIWLTAAALPMAKRDLGGLGITELEQLERPLPSGIQCSVKLVLRREDDGSKHNKVRHFSVVRIDKSESDSFALDDTANDTATKVEDIDSDEPNR